ASNAIWREFTDPHAFERKLQWGSGRLGVTSTPSIPRALADDIMAKDRGHHRCWFILGGRQQLPDPRYDIRLLGGSAVFADQRPPDQLAGESAVVVTTGDPVPALGDPVTQWLNPDGHG